MKKRATPKKQSQRKAVKASKAIPVTKKKFIEGFSRRNKLWTLTPRQLKYRRNRFELGMSQFNAARAAGYSDAYARAHAHKTDRVVKVGIVDELEQAGATDRFMAKKLFDIAANATKLQTCTLLVQADEGGELKITSQDGKIVVPDLHLQKDSIELMAKIKKQLTSSPILPTEGYTKMTIVVEREEPKEPAKDKKDVGSRVQANKPTKLRISTTDES